MDLKNYIHLINCKKNYNKKINSLKYNEKILKVIFLVRENSKWTYDSVYKAMDESEYFEPIIAVSILKDAAIGKDTTRNILQENYNFFKSRNMNVVKVFDDNNNKFISLKIFEPDIIFYDQPYSLPKIHKPWYCSKFALCCYCSYTFELLNDSISYMPNFHKHLWKYFVDCKDNFTRYEQIKKGNTGNCIVTGYPKLDVYFKQDTIKTTQYWKDSEKIKIIYAPHHSFTKDSLKLATFVENGWFILKFAQNHPETTWIFKPHPAFKYILTKEKIMSDSEVQEYYNKWEQVGNIYEQGGYFDIFKTSNLMITDCSSFKAEYLPTLKPLICPIRNDSVEFNTICKKFMKAHYTTHNNNELEQILNELIKGNDSHKQIREQVFNEFLKSDTTIAQTICNEILKGIELKHGK